MGYSAAWDVLEDLMLELRKRGVVVSPEVINDLRSAKLMIKIGESSGNKGETSTKIVEYLGSVESYLIADASRFLDPREVSSWIKRIDEASTKASCEETAENENKFITGIPRDQKWVRIELDAKRTENKVSKMAKDCNLQVKLEKGERIVAYGSPESIKAFLKQMTEVAKKQ